jgi:hypothetical protein
VAQNFLEDLCNRHRRPADASGTRFSFLIAKIPFLSSSPDNRAQIENQTKTRRKESKEDEEEEARSAPEGKGPRARRR